MTPPAAPTATRGILLMILAILLFTAMDATAKGLIERYPAPQVIWTRFAGQLLIVLLLLRQHLGPVLRTRFPVLHFWRSAAQFGATTFFFLSLPHIGLAEATAIADLNPVLITLGAALFLGERLGPRRLAGVLVALVGALIVIRPGAGVFTWWAVLPLLCAVSYATSALLTRKIGAQESVWASMVYAALFGTIVAGLAYLGIIFATGWGNLLYGQWPDHWTVIGALVIVGAGLYVWHRETRASRPD